MRKMKQKRSRKSRRNDQTSLPKCFSPFYESAFQSAVAMMPKKSEDETKKEKEVNSKRGKNAR